MERLREHLGVDRWLLYGGSWGSTLLLAYAERYPERVSEIVISSVTTTRRSEIDWLYRGVGRFFPEQWERGNCIEPGPAQNWSSWRTRGIWAVRRRGATSSGPSTHSRRDRPTL